MNNFKALKTYFKTLATEHLLLQGSFVHGATSKLRSDLLSKVSFPLMWMETPFIEMHHNGSATFARKKGAIVILGQSKKANRTDDEMDDEWDTLEGIALDVISRLYKDAKAGVHKIDISECDLDPVDPLLVDDCIGWRFEFTISNAINICYNADNWTP